ncbi:MAG TPA: hypothetical protein VE981_23650, partial [Planctomycetota bacterium]|nr:hypothetical protein [Planctomycetota bacterium]
PDVNGDRTESVADLGLLIGDTWTGPYRNPAFSPARGPSGRPPVVRDADKVRYTAKLKTGIAGRPAAILLSSPILDDVTLFFAEGRRYLGWVCP